MSYLPYKKDRPRALHPQAPQRKRFRNGKHGYPTSTKLLDIPRLATWPNWSVMLAVLPGKFKLLWSINVRPASLSSLEGPHRDRFRQLPLILYLVPGSA